MHVHISHLRQNLPEYLARVRCGERVGMTSRGKVIAKIVPPTATGSPASAARTRLKASLIRFGGPTAPAIADGPRECSGDRS